MKQAQREIQNWEKHYGLSRKKYYELNDDKVHEVRRKWTKILRKHKLTTVSHPTWKSFIVWALTPPSSPRQSKKQKRYIKVMPNMRYVNNTHNVDIQHNCDNEDSKIENIYSSNDNYVKYEEEMNEFIVKCEDLYQELLQLGDDTFMNMSESQQKKCVEKLVMLENKDNLNT